MVIKKLEDEVGLCAVKRVNLERLVDRAVIGEFETGFCVGELKLYLASKSFLTLLASLAYQGSRGVGIFLTFPSISTSYRLLI